MTRRKFVQVPSQGEKKTAVWQSRSSKGQNAFFEEYKSALKPDGLCVGEALDDAEEAGMPAFVVNELRELFGMLNGEVQFLLADGLITFFSKGKREFTGLQMLDAILDPLFVEMERYLFPFGLKDEQELENDL